MHETLLQEWKNQGESSLNTLAKSVADNLVLTPHFCLWLEGEMGAGKTTFTRYLLKTLGLDVNTPVTSPTFAYMNEYLIGKRLYAHLDLYRLTQDWDPEELGLNIEKGFAGVIIEWPRNGQNIDLLQATHRLEISSSTHENFRDYRLFSSAT